MKVTKAVARKKAAIANTANIAPAGVVVVAIGGATVAGTAMAEATEVAAAAIEAAEAAAIAAEADAADMGVVTAAATAAEVIGIDAVTRRRANAHGSLGPWVSLFIISS